MIFPAARDARVIRMDRGADATLAETLSSDSFCAVAKVLKRDVRSSVLAGESPLGPIVVKSLLLDRPKDFLSRAFGVTRLVRQWRGAEVLSRRGFAVARPLILWRGRDERGRVVESLAMERLPGRTILQHLADRDLPPEVEAAVARRLGEDIARLARLGYVNRDHKPSNLLLVREDSTSRHGDTEGEAGVAHLDPSVSTASDSIWINPNASPRRRASVVNDFRIAILDTVGIRRSRSPRDALVRMLFALTVECVGTGTLPRLSTRLTLARAAAAGLGLPDRDLPWLWLDVRERLGRHGDPRPRVDPLPNHTEERDLQ